MDTYKEYFEEVTYWMDFLKSDRFKFRDDMVQYYSSLFKEAQRAEGFQTEIEAAVQQSDWAKLQGIFYHRYKIDALPYNRSVYTMIWTVWAALSCGKTDDVKKLMPCGYPVSKGHHPMNDQAANVMLCILYGEDKEANVPVDKLIAGAEKFAASKKTLYDRMLVDSMLAVFHHDAKRLSDSLFQVCKGVFRTEFSGADKVQSREAYGILVLAKQVWTEAEFAKIVYPEYKDFSIGYLEWLFAQDKPPEDIGITYPEVIDEISSLIALPIAETKLTYYEKKIAVDGDALLRELLHLQKSGLEKGNVSDE